MHSSSRADDGSPETSIVGVVSRTGARARPIRVAQVASTMAIATAATPLLIASIGVTFVLAMVHAGKEQH